MTDNPFARYDVVLKNPDLLNLLVKEVQKRVAGEDKAIKVIILSAMGAMTKNVKKFSFNLLVNSKSGIGKDYVVQNTLDLFPAESVVRRTKISPMAFNYWHSSKWEPNWTWDGKICYFVDIHNDILNHDVFKVMITEGSHATIVIDHRATDIEIKGKPISICTTAQGYLKTEMLRRFNIVYLDESHEQSQRIVQMTLNGGEKYAPLVLEALDTLKPTTIYIPQAIKDKIAKVFSIEAHQVRTWVGKFMDIIKASASLHRHQRELAPNADGYIANETDFDNAMFYLQQVMPHQNFVSMTRSQTKIYNLFPDNPLNLPYETDPTLWLCRKDIQRKTPLSQPQIDRILDWMLEQEVLNFDEQQIGTGRPTRIFSKKDIDISLQIKSKMNNSLIDFYSYGAYGEMNKTNNENTSNKMNSMNITQNNINMDVIDIEMCKEYGNPVVEKAFELAMKKKLESGGCIADGT